MIDIEKDITSIANCSRSGLDGYNISYGENLKPIKPNPITLPYRYKGRFYQNELLNVFKDMLLGNNDYRNFYLEWHRRAGKDMTFFQCVVMAAVTKIGDYGYTLPTNNQAKKVILEGKVIDYKGQPCKFTDFIPRMMLKGINASEGIIRLTNGSNIYVVGSDNYNRLVGMNLSGCVFSEWSLCQPKSYDYISPMLEETHNQDKGRGWALFCWTPRGKNHAYKSRCEAIKECNKDIFYFSRLTIDDTGAYTHKQYQRWVDSGKDEDTLKQEYYLDYDALKKGLVYQKELGIVKQEKRIRSIEIDKSIPVLTFWDIGVSDETTIWFMQPSKKGEELYLINYYENNGQGVDHYIEYLKTFAKEHGIKYGTVYLPHDGKNREWAAGKRRYVIVQEAGFDVRCIERTSTVQLAINQTKQIFYRFVFDENRCQQGLNCLENYVYTYNERMNVTGKPLHNWASNGADALRQIGQYYSDGYRDVTLTKEFRDEWDRNNQQPVDDLIDWNDDWE